MYLQEKKLTIKIILMIHWIIESWSFLGRLSAFHSPWLGNSSNSPFLLTFVSVLAQVMPFSPAWFSSPCLSSFWWMKNRIPGFNCGLLFHQELAFLNGWISLHDIDKETCHLSHCYRWLQVMYIVQVSLSPCLR